LGLPLSLPVCCCSNRLSISTSGSFCGSQTSLLKCQCRQENTVKSSQLDAVSVRKDNFYDYNL
jgi:hypothetical protein